MNNVPMGTVRVRDSFKLVLFLSLPGRRDPLSKRSHYQHIDDISASRGGRYKQGSMSSGGRSRIGGYDDDLNDIERRTSDW